MPNPTFDINDLVAPVGRQSPYPFTMPSPAQQNPQLPTGVTPTQLVADSGRSELDDLLNQSPETQFLGQPTPPPSPTPAPVKKDQLYAT